MKSRNQEITTTALVNSGYESHEPEIVLPPSLARRLGLTPTAIAELEAAGGHRLAAYTVDTKITVELAIEDREAPRTEAIPVIVAGEKEVIISDRLASELGIVILDPYHGHWCLRDELGRQRPSSPPQYWDQT